jgi:hypothetical protein
MVSDAKRRPLESPVRLLADDHRIDKNANFPVFFRGRLKFWQLGVVAATGARRLALFLKLACMLSRCGVISVLRRR